jgi:hypothetical protein
LLEEQKAVKEKKNFEKAEKKRQISSKVKAHGGPCLVPEDVGELLTRVETNGRGTRGQKVDAIRAEIQYQKIVLGFQSTHLKVTGSLEEITRRLESYLTETRNVREQAEPEQDVGCLSDEDSLDDDVVQDTPTVVQHTPAKQLILRTPSAKTAKCCLNDVQVTPTGEQRTPARRLVQRTPSAKTAKRRLDEESDAASESEDEQPCKRKPLNQYKFRQQGTWVAVYYDDNFYLGQVVQIVNEEGGEVQFLERCGLSKKAFRWPVREDISFIKSQYVFSNDIEVTTQNLRTLLISQSEVDRLGMLYKQYKTLYC